MKRGWRDDLKQQWESDLRFKAQVAKQDIPQTEAGQPEAGLQADMFGGVKEVRPAGNGKAKQISLEAWARLNQIKEEG